MNFQQDYAIIMKTYTSPLIYDLSLEVELSAAGSINTEATGTISGDYAIDTLYW